MAILDELVSYLRIEGYHPRSSKHSDFQSLIIIRDVVDQCPILAQRAVSGEIVAKLRHHQQVGHADWVIDVAIGTCAGNPAPLSSLEGTKGPRSSARRNLTKRRSSRANNVRSNNTPSARARARARSDMESLRVAPMEAARISPLGPLGILPLADSPAGTFPGRGNVWERPIRSAAHGVAER